MTTVAATRTQPEPARVLAKSVRNAGKALGLSQEETGQAVGRARSSLLRPLDPDTKAGELGLLLVRCYRSLFAMVGGDEDAMKHWMATENLHTGGVPKEQVKSVQGLVAVVSYLDAIRGKT